MSVFFTSDQHFRHNNVIEFCKRPFGSIEDMTESLIENWNDRVTKSDLVYCLGDFALTWKKKDCQPEIDRLLARLNGNKQLIVGNHDREAVTKAKGWSWVGDYKRIVVEGQAIVLFHYPIRSWHGIHRGSWHLHGHCHGTLLEDGGGCIMDVGVDCNGYAPVSFEDVARHMQGRRKVVVDHHA